MQITHIKLKDFRSYPQLAWSPAPGINLLVGKNGAGKTNILESVYLCCLGRSHRTARDGEMIRREAEMAYAGVEISRADGPRSVEVLLKPKERKGIKVGGFPIGRLSDLMGHICCVFFTPDDLYLLKGGPGLRRRFMDSGLCQLRPAYYLALHHYRVTLAQRNALLRQRAFDRALLEAFDATLAGYGAQVVGHRQGYLIALAQKAEEKHAQIAPGEILRLSYRTQVGGEDEAQRKERLLQLLQNGREEDIRRFQTSVGPHRDDIGFHINGENARQYGSQGQQRTAALALKLAEAEAMAMEIGESPLIMLDDVLSELDTQRQQALLRLQTGQMLITCASLPKDSAIPGKQWTVQGGLVTD